MRLVAKYRRAGDLLIAERDHILRPGMLVVVDHDRYRGLAVVTAGSSCPPDRVSVVPEHSMYTCYFPIESVELARVPA